jgi:hypothetical protein
MTVKAEEEEEEEEEFIKQAELSCWYRKNSTK